MVLYLNVTGPSVRGISISPKGASTLKRQRGKGFSTAGANRVAASLPFIEIRILRKRQAWIAQLFRSEFMRSTCIRYFYIQVIHAIHAFRQNCAKRRSPKAATLHIQTT